MTTLLAACALASSLAAGSASAATLKVDVPPEKLDPVETSVLVGRLSDKDGGARRKAFKTVVAEYDQRTFPSEVLAPLGAGLTDSEAGIRRDAAFALAALASKVYISSRNADGSAFGAPVKVDFASHPPLRAALLSALASADPEVRRYAPLALGLAYPPARDIEDALAARWKSEKAPLPLRNVVVALSRAGYSSPGTVELFKEALRRDDRILQIRARRALRRLGVAPAPKKT